MVSKRNLQIGIWILLFIISRLVVLRYPPYHQVIKSDGSRAYEGYSDVQHDYERYANMWKYGLTPYYEHLYEYPPATIPLVYLPLEIDLAGFGHYYEDYRLLVSVLELFFFLGLLHTLFHFPLTFKIRSISLLFYVVAGLWAKDYWYEGLDLVFALSVTTAIMLKYTLRSHQLLSSTFFWTFFWLSTALKFMTLPLALPYFLLGKNNWKQELVASGIGFLIIWGLPLAYFRSALSVSVVFHLGRPLKYGSLGTLIIKTINDFTNTEIQTDILPHLPMAGPITNMVEKSFSVIFPIAILTVIGTACIYLLRQQKKVLASPLNSLSVAIKLTLIYFIVLFLTTKVFSSPFHIWYVPLLTLFPYMKLRQQLTAFFFAFFMLGMDTTPYLKVSSSYMLGKLKLEHLRDWFRYIPMVLMLFLVPRLKTAHKTT